MVGEYKYCYNREWILENYFKYPNNKMLVEAHNKKFGTDITYKAFSSFVNRELGMAGKRNESILYTEEQDKWLKENYFKYGSYCFDDFNKVFGVNRGKRPLQTHCKRMGFKVDKKVSDSHQLGNTQRERKIGDVWKDSKTGFLMIKVAKVERNQYESIKRLHRYVWEKENGQIPDGHKVIFLDGNRENCDISNLFCVSNKFLMWMNKYHLNSEHPEITKTGIKWCELYEVFKNNEMGFFDESEMDSL